jgi:hypothetical protein
VFFLREIAKDSVHLSTWANMLCYGGCAQHPELLLAHAATTEHIRTHILLAPESDLLSVIASASSTPKYLLRLPGVGKDRSRNLHNYSAWESGITAQPTAEELASEVAWLSRFITEVPDPLSSAECRTVDSCFTDYDHENSDIPCDCTVFN